MARLLDSHSLGVRDVSDIAGYRREQLDTAVSGPLFIAMTLLRIQMEDEEDDGDAQSFGMQGLVTVLRAVASNAQSRCSTCCEKKPASLADSEQVGPKWRAEDCEAKEAQLMGVDEVTKLLAIGMDLTNLGLDVAATNELSICSTFDGPFGSEPTQVHFVEEKNLPKCFLEAEEIPPVRFTLLPEDTLFYLFFNFAHQSLQSSAAQELYRRRWRYHVTEKCWFRRPDSSAHPHGSLPPTVREQTGDRERGYFYVFDPISWRKVLRAMRIEYAQLEGPPTVDWFTKRSSSPTSL